MIKCDTADGVLFPPTSDIAVHVFLPHIILNAHNRCADILLNMLQPFSHLICLLRVTFTVCFFPSLFLPYKSTPHGASVLITAMSV